MKRYVSCPSIILGLLFLTSITTLAQTTYFWNGTGALGSIASWGVNYDGSGANPATSMASGTGRVYVIKPSQSAAATTALNLGASNTLLDSGTLSLSGTGAITVGTFQLTGTWTNNTTSTHSITNFNMASGSRYNHDAAIASIPGTNRSFHSNSHQQINNWTTAAFASGFAWGNLTISIPALSGSINASIAASGTYNVLGNLRIIATGGGTNEWRISNNNNVTLSVGGDFILEGGRFDFGNNGGAGTTINVSGNMQITGGTWDHSGANLWQLNVGGNLERTGGTFNDGLLNLSLNGSGNQSITGSSTHGFSFRNLDFSTKISGNVQILSTNGVMTLTALNNVTANFTQSNTHQFSDNGNTLAVGGSLSLDGSKSAYNLSGTIIMTGLQGGSPCIQNNSTDRGAVVADLNHLTLDFTGSTITNFDFQPTTGSGNITIKGNLTINSGGTVSNFIRYFSNRLVVKGNFTYSRTADIFGDGTGTGTLELAGNAVQTFSTSVTGGIRLINLEVSNSAGIVNISSPIQISRSGGFVFGANSTVSLGNNTLSTWGSSGTASFSILGKLSTTNTNGLAATAGSPSILVTHATLTLGANSEIDYQATANQTITNTLEYKKLRISGSGTKTLSTGTTWVQDSLIIQASCSLAIGLSNTLIINGEFVSAGSLIGSSSSNLTVGGSASALLLPGPISINNLNVNRSAGLVAGGTITLNGNLSVAANCTLDLGTAEHQIVSGGGTPVISVDGVIRTADTDGLTGTNTSIPSIAVNLNAGSYVDYYRNGNQVVTSLPYRNLIIRGFGTKSTTGANPTIESLQIRDNAIFNVDNNTTGGAGTALIMADNAIFRVAGSGTKPDPSGTYALGANTTIEFGGSAATDIRIAPIYANISITGTNVRVAAVSDSIKLQASRQLIIAGGAKLTQLNPNSKISFQGTGGQVINNGTLTVTARGGLSGNDTSFISMHNSPFLSLSVASTAEFAATSGRQIINSRADYARILVSGVRNIGSTVVLPEGNLSIKRDFTCTGTGFSWVNTNNTLVFDGNVPQQLTGNVDLFNLTIGNNTTISSGTVTLSNLLKAQTGLLNANGNLVMLSNATQQAKVDFSGAGSVLGNIVVQRYLSGRNNAWRGFSAPVAATYGDISPTLDLGTLGQSGANLITLRDMDFWAGASWQKASNWRIAADTNINATPSSIITPGRGFLAYGGISGIADLSSPTTLDLTGTLNNQMITAPGLVGSDKSYNGWMLMGNPYLATLDWENMFGTADVANLNATIYLFNSSAGSWDSYNATTNTRTGSGTNLIAPFQAFMVKASNATVPTLNFRTSQTSTATSNYNLRQQNSFPIVRLNVKKNNAVVQTALTLIAAQATDGLDADYDAQYPGSFNGHDFYSMTTGDYKLQQNSRPMPASGSINEPYYFEYNGTGNYSIAPTLENVDPMWNVYLEDKISGAMHNLRTSAYNFSHQAANRKDRFVLHINAMTTSVNEVANDQVPIVSMQNGSMNVRFAGVAASRKLEVVDLSGKVLRTVVMENATAATIEMGDLAQAVYLLRVTGSGNTKLTKFVNAR